MDDLGLVFLHCSLRLSQASHFGRNVVLPFGKVEFHHAQALLNRHEFIVAFAQFVPCDKDLFDELFNGVSFEHPFEGRSLIVG